jgi:hypothetical protein
MSARPLDTSTSRQGGFPVRAEVDAPGVPQGRLRDSRAWTITKLFPTSLKEKVTAMARRSWYDLSWKEQRTVLRLARRGNRHPDPNVARAAEEWAREWFQRASDKSYVVSWTVTVIVGGVLGDGSSIGEALRNRRAAKRIMRVSERPL